MKRYEWKLTDGRTVTLEAEYKEFVQDKIVNLDGDICNTGEREIIKRAMLTAYIDSKKFDSCRDVNFWRIIDVKSGIKKIWGIKQIAFTDERATEIEAFLKTVLEEGSDPEAEEIRTLKQAEEIEKKIKAANETIVKAEAQKDIPTREEARRRMKEYNDINNEGGFGYVPYIVSREEYDEAKKIIAQYSVKSEL